MNLLFAALLLLPLGALLSTFCGRRATLASWSGAGTVVVAGLLVLVAAGSCLWYGTDTLLRLPWSVPVGEFALHLDPLAAAFVLPIALLSVVCAIYGAGYLHHEGAHRSLAPHWFFFNLMVAAMLLVVTAANAVLFLCAWEIMTIASFFLVAWDHHLAEVRRAAWLYLLAAHCGLMLLLAFFVQAAQQCGSFNFADFAPLAQLSPSLATLFFLLVLFGFGVKAGLFPVHIWLPDAHPAAPSHVSALMSGVLIKTGIYGIVRVLTWLPPAPVWWGWLMAVLGIVGALYGIAMASLQRDIKRCLAYSTIENVGIIFLGLGLALVAAAQGQTGLALLAGTGSLLHLWNHALFKGLMFLGAGSLLHATGTRDMNLMGGLLKRLPVTGLLWIGGSLAISALPPFNGLVSEWLIYLSLIQAGLQTPGFAALAPLLLVGLLGLVGALALLTFVRLIGISLLGEPRSPQAEHAHEANSLMLAPMGLLLAGCLLIGLFPAQVVELLHGPLAALLHQSPPAPLRVPLTSFGHWNLLLLALLLVLGLWLRHLRLTRPLAETGTWGCGYGFIRPRMAYTAEGFSELIFRRVLPSYFRPKVEGGQVEGLFPVTGNLSQTSLDPVLTRHWQPLFFWVAERSQRLRWLQQGQLPIYLLYMFAISTLLLMWSLWAGQGG